jgi:hypothetical protein
MCELKRNLGRDVSQSEKGVPHGVALTRVEADAAEVPGPPPHQHHLQLCDANSTYVQRPFISLLYSFHTPPPLIPSPLRALGGRFP